MTLACHCTARRTSPLEPRTKHEYTGAGIDALIQEILEDDMVSGLEEVSRAVNQIVSGILSVGINSQSKFEMSAEPPANPSAIQEFIIRIIDECMYVSNVSNGNIVPMVVLSKEDFTPVNVREIICAIMSETYNVFLEAK